MGAAGNAGHGLSINAASGSATGTFNNVEVVKGTIAVTGTEKGAATLSANNITLQKDGTITLTGHADGASTLGTTKTVYSLASGSTINIGSGSSVLGNISNASGGNIKFTDAGTLQAFGSGADLNITVDATKTGTIALADDDTDTSANESLLSLSKGTIQVVGAASSSTAGKLAITKGTVSLGEEVVLAATTNEEKTGTIQVGDASTSGKLELAKKATLQNFLSGKNLPTTITTAKKGALDIAASGNVVINDDIKLSDFEYATSAAAGKISAADGAELTANNVTVEAAAAGASTLTVVANDLLTLGKEGTAAFSAGVKEFKAKNVTFESTAYNQPYTLQDMLTLSSTTKVGDVTKATTGTITANPEGVLVSGGSAKPLTIDGGIYAADKIGVKSGSIAVSNTLADLSKLSIGTLSLDNTGGADNAISVSGGTDKEAVLDLSNTTLSLKGHDTNKTTITVGQNGTLLVSGENLAKLINKENAWSGTAGAGILINQGTVDTLLTDIDAELSVGDLISGSTVTANKIVFHESNGGTLNTQSVTLVDSDGNGVLDIGGEATLDVGNTLSIKDANSGDLVVQTGNIVVGEAIKAASGSKNGTKLVLGKDTAGSATLQLGDIYFDEDTNKIEHTAEKANVNVDLELAGKATSDTSELNVKYGHWTAKDITAKNATITIGSSDFEVEGAKDP